GCLRPPRTRARATSKSASSASPSVGHEDNSSFERTASTQIRAGTLPRLYGESNIEFSKTPGRTLRGCAHQVDQTGRLRDHAFDRAAVQRPLDPGRGERDPLDLLTGHIGLDLDAVADLAVDLDHERPTLLS